MPIRRSSLSKAEEADCSDCLRELQAEGINVEALPDSGPQLSGVLDIRVGLPGENLAFEAWPGGVGHYAVRLRLVASVSRLVLSECELETAWDQKVVMESFEASGSSRFQFLGQSFRREEVLNDRIEDGLRLYRGQPVDGWLLASGLVPIPSEFHDSRLLACKLTFRDSLSREVQTDAPLSLLRAPKPRAESGEQPLKGLYAGPPPEPDVVQEAQRRYRELLAKEKEEREAKAKQQASTSKRAEISIEVLAKRIRDSLKETSGIGLDTQFWLQ